MARKSLYPIERECWICHTTLEIECHHIYPSSRRPISDREGCTVFLCHEHHQGRTGVHSDMDLMEFFKKDCQRRWEEREGLEGEEAHDAFRKVFYESYL